MALKLDDVDEEFADYLRYLRQLVHDSITYVDICCITHQHILDINRGDGSDTANGVNHLMEMLVEMKILTDISDLHADTNESHITYKLNRDLLDQILREYKKLTNIPARANF